MMMLSKNSTADPNVVHLTIDIVLVLDLEIGRATALRLKERERERERENSVFVYRNKQAGAKTRWVRYIAVNY